MTDLIGKSIGRYKIIEKLGQGGMAAVYRAQDTRLKRSVAVKIILPTRQASEVFLKRFIREAETMAGLNHPNIVGIIDFGEQDNEPYLVMPYLPGGTLKDRLGSPMRYAEAIHLLLPVARALHYAHKKGMIHRDVKPSNILFAESGDPMLTDFGIVKLLSEGEGTTITAAGAGVGTPEYMAPEQIKKDFDHRVDVYALGVVLYELITGRPPFKGDTPMDTLVKHVNQPPAPPRERVPELPKAVEDVILKALAKNPAERFADMGTFADAMEKLTRQQIKSGVPRRSASAKVKFSPPPDANATYDELAGPPADKPRPASPVHPTRQKPALPRWLGWVGAAVVGLALLGGVVLPAVEREHLQATAQAEIAAATQATADRSTAIAVAWIATLSKTPTPDKTSTPKATPKSSLEIGSTKLHEKDNMEMVYVPAGEFLMGSEYGDSNESPEHTVFLDAFWIDKFEVTNAQYRMCVEYGKCEQPNNTEYYDDDKFTEHPVVYVSWFDASNYCQWAGERLPTEAEWEKAARGTDGRTYPWGEGGLDCQHAQYGGCNGGTIPVGSLPAGASPYGALDMAGNVWEWTSSLYKDYPYDPLDGREDPDVSGLRAMRGGSWYYSEWLIRTAYRDRYYSDFASFNFGFRCALSPATP